METLKILIFAGSAREGNYTQHVAEFVRAQTAQRSDVSVQVVSPHSLQLKFQDEGEQAKPQYPELTQLVSQADAFIIVSPEYNHGYAGSLKYMLDLHLKEYIHKPVAMVGVSSQVSGGTRMIEALTGVVRELGLVATFNDVNFGSVKDEIVDGKVVDPEKWQRRVDRLLDELIWMAQALKWGRANLS